MIQTYKPYTTGPAVTINGRPLPMMTDTNLGVRYELKGYAAYANIRGVIDARDKTTKKHVVFLELATRYLLRESETTATVLEPTQATIWVEMVSSLTHIVKFVPAIPAPPNQPSTKGQYFCFRVWATKPGWELK
jgi:hypothetical protein